MRLLCDHYEITKRLLCEYHAVASATQLSGEWCDHFETAADAAACGATLSRLLSLYVERNAALWKVITM